MADTPHVISTALDTSDEYLNTLLAKRLVKGHHHVHTRMVADKVVTELQRAKASDSYTDRTMGRYFYQYSDTEVMTVTNRFNTGQVWFIAIADSAERAEEMTNEFEKELDDYKGADVPEGQVRINFWNMSGRGPVRRPRKLDMPTWDDIRINYEHFTGSQIHEFMTMKDWDDSRGKLIIWRGDPGLGKTYALRAMCNNWKEWASIHYITDPEQFLSDPDYLYSVMGFDPDDGPGSLAAFFDEEDNPVAKEDSPITHRLIILEDAGELVGTTARAETGQALSRLLNAVDGMFGQGTRCVLLITTNEEKGDLHEAVGRHGRCAKDVTFQTFSKGEAADWLEAHDADPRKAKNGMSLADLYAAMHEHKNSEAPDKSIGFAGVV